MSKIRTKDQVRIGSTLYAEANSFGKWISYKVVDVTTGTWILDARLTINKRTMRERSDRYGMGRRFYTVKQHADLMWLQENKMRASAIVGALRFEDVDLLRAIVAKLIEHGYQL